MWKHIIFYYKIIGYNELVRNKRILFHKVNKESIFYHEKIVIYEKNGKNKEIFIYHETWQKLGAVKNGENNKQKYNTFWEAHNLQQYKSNHYEKNPQMKWIV